MSVGFPNGLNILQKPLINQNISLDIEMTFMKPEARCTKCHYDLSEEEILKGYSKNPEDYTTECPKCHKRFMAYVRLLDIEDVELVKCPFISTEHIFRNLEEIINKRSGRSLNLGPKFLAEKHPLLFINLIRYHGNYNLGQKAFVEWYKKPATKKPYAPSH